MSVSNKQIISAYRQLFRKGLHAIQYSKPARYNLKRVLEDAFRNGTPADFNARKIGNTLLFLSNAAKETGLEHKIVKNLLFVRHWEEAFASRKFESKTILQWDSSIHKNAYRHFEITIKMLNESMDMCLR